MTMTTARLASAAARGTFLREATTTTNTAFAVAAAPGWQRRLSRGLASVTSSSAGGSEVTSNKPKAPKPAVVQLQAMQAQEKLVEELRGRGLLQDERLAEAFSKVNRGRFFEKKHTNLIADEGAFAAEGPAPAAPNDGKVLPLDCAVDHVQQSELLLPWLKPGNVVLDCGCGSGYLAAVYAVMVAGKAETGGKVVGVDRRGSLADTAIPRVGETCKELLGAGLVDDSVLKRIIVMPLDGVGDLPLPGGPFDAIRVGFGFPQDQDAKEGDGCEELSRLLDQLRPGGRLVAHMGPKATGPTIFDKAADGTVTRVRSSVASVHVPAPFERRVAVEGEDPESDAQAQAAEDKRLARRSALQDELRAWREEFERSQGRRPTRHDMVADAKAAALFQEFNKLNTGDLSKL